MKIRPFAFDEKTFRFEVLDQTLLPSQLKYKEIEDTRDGFDAIKQMLVRGAPCIAAVACLSIITELNNKLDMFSLSSTQDLVGWLDEKSSYLNSSRPTAVNLKQALNKLVEFAHQNQQKYNLETMRNELTGLCIKALIAGQVANESLGAYGAEEFRKIRSGGLKLLTHCNTGALATVGHGTALGVIRSLHELGKLERAYCTETRPYNQGSRLTAWELIQEEIPATLIADNMVAALLSIRQIDAVVVGADRVTANGDTANKIGTLQIAVLAKHYEIPFYVAAPSQSVDLSTSCGADITIEHRPADEMRKLGNYQLAPDTVDVWNPCFDVTPAELISGIITEFGVCHPDGLRAFLERNHKQYPGILF